MKLFEVLDSPQEATWIEKTDDKWRANFNIGDAKYQLLISLGKKTKWGAQNWYIELIDKGTPHTGPRSSTNPTERNHPNKVLSTAIKLIDEFIDEVDPKVVEVQTADTKGKNGKIQNVIDRLTQRYMKKGYTARQGKWDFGDPTKRTTFTKEKPPKFRPKPYNKK